MERHDWRADHHRLLEQSLPQRPERTVAVGVDGRDTSEQVGLPRLAHASEERRFAVRGDEADERRHALVLGKGIEGVEIIDGFANYKKKDAQEARDAAVDAGKTPMLRHEYEDAALVAKDVRESLEDLGYALTGISEAVVTWYEQSEYGPVKCRAMMDHLRLDLCAVWDFKTSNSAHPRAIQSHIMEYGYDIQESAYRSALRKLVPGSAGRESFTFLFCETMPPGSPRRALITPCRLNGTFRAIGENRWRRAVELWAKCNRDDLWPAYTESCIEIEPPTWALRNEVAEGVAIEPV